jgi:hypothetical protein
MSRIRYFVQAGNAAYKRNANGAGHVSYVDVRNQQIYQIMKDIDIIHNEK